MNVKTKQGKKMKNKSNEVQYPKFSKWVWRNYDGTNIVSVENFIKMHYKDFFFIGTDSQNYKKHWQCVFTTVLIAYKLRHGGSVITHTDKVSYITSLRQRLLLEAMRSLEMAWFLDGKIPKESVISIHLDVNSNIKWESAKYKNELVSLIASQGYKCLVKPDSFAASCVADNKT